MTTAKHPRVPDIAFELAGMVFGGSASVFIAEQIRAELGSSQPSTLSPLYVAGFLLIYLFWTAYGVRFRRSAVWVTNAAAASLQTVLLVMVIMGRG
ncbi:MAG: hypothetical protein GF331_14905 [Chitinivibrionales bacterium]|nr:hypothetical protein [Chitinivibrionales bacterium]